MSSAFYFHINFDGILRHVRLHSLLVEGLVRVEGVDGQKPAWIDLEPRLFPWRDLAHYLAQSWQLSRPVPKAFRPVRRIPPEILAVLSAPGLTHTDALEILKSLRKNQFLPTIRQDNRIIAT